jgi:hypothetical protein
MRRALWVVLPFVAGCSVPFSGPSTSERKSECDQIAARAIQTSSLADARDLAARASECYAAAIGS